MTPGQFATKLRHFLKERLLRRRDLSLLSEPAVPAFWETAHQRSAHLWLTGSDPGEVIKRLGVGDQINACRFNSGTAQILDVGVGEGLMAQHLARLGVRHDVLDISPTAVSNVANLCAEGFTASSDLPERRYAVVMHHLVAQHMSHDDLRAQLADLVRSLREDGFISLQYSATAAMALAASDDAEHQKMGAVTRNPDWFIAATASIEAFVIEDTETDAFGDIRFRVVRIGRAHEKC